MTKGKNVLGTPLQSCSMDPRTGFYRDGCCTSGPDDDGMHWVCVVLTDEFLKFSKSRGNDLTTPIPEYDFPGLKAGDRWCLCVQRWTEAHQAGFAPRVALNATHMSTLEFVDLEVLKEFAAKD